MVLNSPTITGSLTVTGNIITSGSITLSGSVASASFAQTASFVANAQTASFVATAQTASFVANAQTASFVTLAQTASFVANAQSASNAVNAITASSADDFLARGTITAQTLVVQTITSSVDFVTGSTRFGSIIGNTHQFTGSVSITGSLTTSIAALGSAASLFLVSDGNVIKSRTAAQTLSDIGGQAALTNPVTGTGTTNYLPKFTGASTIGNSIMYEGTNAIGINTNSPTTATGYSFLTTDGANGGGYTTKVNGTISAYFYSIASESRISEQRALPLVFETSGSERMRITSGGNTVLGGNAGSGWSTASGRTTLEIYGSIYPAALHNSSAIGNSLSYNTYWDGTNWRYVQAANTNIYIQDSEGHKFFFNSSGTAGASFTPTERMRITSDGYLRLASKGIQFNNDTAAANALNDYEEGTWTPVIRGSGTAGTYQLQTDYTTYTKIGRQVTVSAAIRLGTSITGGGTGYLQITGLPFQKAASTAGMGAVLLNGVDFTGNYATVSFVTIGATSILYIAETVDNSAPIDLPISAVSANDEIAFSITYFT